MRTSCVRPGCGGSVAAAVLIDRDQQLVVLHSPDVAELGSMALCAKHIDRVSAPAGWEVRDQRVLPAPVVEPVVAAVPTAPTNVVQLPVRPPAVDDDTDLYVDDGVTPLLGRAFRAASPGELKRPGESRGFAWLERALPEDSDDAAAAVSPHCHTRPRD